jgi:hypothetical protein
MKVRAAIETRIMWVRSLDDGIPHAMTKLQFNGDFIYHGYNNVLFGMVTV